MPSLSRCRAPRDLVKHTLAVVMAGGTGTRLGELTRWDCKPALPFGGQYRNIDFPLSNCLNSGIRRMAVLTQYKAHSLIQHVQQGWSFLRPELDEYVELWPAQQRKGQRWYDGTADAVYQNIDLIVERMPDHVLVLAGDHVYKMDYAPMLEAHAMAGADVTVGCVEVPIGEARAFGVMGIDESGWVREFAEKPQSPKSLPGSNPLAALGSMGIYVFSRELLLDALIRDAADPDSAHDFGRDLLPRMVAEGRVLAHSFAGTRRNDAYWRDVGTLDSYWAANMDLLDDDPVLDLHDDSWPIWTHQPSRAPSRLLRGSFITQSIVAGGSQIAGQIEHSVAFADCVVGTDTVVRDSLILPKARIGRNCRITNAIVDSGCDIPDGTVIGEDPIDDSASFDISAGGIVLVTAARLKRIAENARDQLRRAAA